MADPLAITILIATAGQRPQLLQRTLDSLRACEHPAGLTQTIVIENGPQPQCRAIVDAFADAPIKATYRHSPIANKSTALNEAMGEISEGLVFFTDDDVRLAPQTLRVYAEAAQAPGRGHFFGGPVGIDYEGDPPPSWVAALLPLSVRGYERRVDEACVIESVAPFLGINWAAFADDIHAAGGFNTSVGPGAASGATGQETDMHHRLMHRGLRAFYLPHAKVWHTVPPQRCSADWVLARQYRSGLAGGRIAARLGRWGNGRVGPYRSYAFLSWLSLRERLAHLFAPAAQRQFIKQGYAQLKRGVRDGYCNEKRSPGANADA